MKFGTEEGIYGPLLTAIILPLRYLVYLDERNDNYISIKILRQEKRYGTKSVTVCYFIYLLSIDMSYESVHPIPTRARILV